MKEGRVNAYDESEWRSCGDTLTDPGLFVMRKSDLRIHERPPDTDGSCDYFVTSGRTRRLRTFAAKTGFCAGRKKLFDLKRSFEIRSGHFMRI